MYVYTIYTKYTVQCTYKQLMHVFIHTYIHTYVHTYIHTYIHAYVDVLVA